MSADLIAVPHTAMEPAEPGQRPKKILIGNQRPRLWYLPPATSYESGIEAVELSAASGLVLDDWQAWCLTAAMGTAPDDRWSAFEVALIIARQNGKNAILEARELAALFLTNEALTIHTAHEFKAAQEQFRRLRGTIENRRSLIKRVKTITTSHGEEAIELLPTPTIIMGSEGKYVKASVAPRLRFLARSRGSGRSFTCFSGGTRYWTRDGLKTLAETAGTTQEVLADAGPGYGGAWCKAEISSFGKAPLWAVTLQRNKQTKVIQATADHRWLVRDSRQDSPDRVLTTRELHAGHRLAWRLPKSKLGRSVPSPFGIAHGMVFGDGTRTQWSCEVQLWGEKDAQMLRYFPESRRKPIRTPGGVDGVRVRDLPLFFKDRPAISEAVPYLYGWLAGYFAADGCVSKDGLPTLASVSRENLEFAQLVATRLGMGTYSISRSDRPDCSTGAAYAIQFVSSTLRPEFFLIAEHRERFMAAHAESHRPGRWPKGQRRTERIGWKVVSAEPTADVEEVFCATVPEHENFVLEDWINVKNCDLLVWDESMILSEDQVGAAMPTLSAVWNPQLWYTGSAGDEMSIQLARIRRRGVSADAKRRAAEETGLVARPTLTAPVLDSLMFAEWSIDPCHEYCVQLCPRHRDRVNCLPSCSAACPDHDDPHSVKSWARANPGLGIRISTEHVQRELTSMSPNGVSVVPPDTFARERLTVGNWPTDEFSWSVIPEAVWRACGDPDSARPRAPLAISADVTPDGSAGSIAIAGMRPDGKIVVEIAEGDHRSGTSWMVPRLAALRRALKPCVIIVDRAGPASMLLDDCEQAGLMRGPKDLNSKARPGGAVESPTLNEIAQSFGIFYRAVHDRTLVHLGETLQPDLHAAVAGSARRDLADGAHAWARKSTSVDISPLVAATLAVWGHGRYGSTGSYDLIKSIG